MLSLLAIPVFVCVYLVATLLWPVPSSVAVAYLAMSLLCFLVYAWDKSAARAGRWRTRESSMLMLGLLCGWPGGLLAQQWLRHKSAKVSFLWRFWITVLLNVAGFLVLSARH